MQLGAAASQQAPCAPHHPTPPTHLPAHPLIPCPSASALQSRRREQERLSRMDEDYEAFEKEQDFKRKQEELRLADEEQTARRREKRLKKKVRGSCCIAAALLLLPPPPAVMRIVGDGEVLAAE